MTEFTEDWFTGAFPVGGEQGDKGLSLLVFHRYRFYKVVGEGFMILNRGEQITQVIIIDHEPDMVVSERNIVIRWYVEFGFLLAEYLRFMVIVNVFDVELTE